MPVEHRRRVGGQATLGLAQRLGGVTQPKVGAILGPGLVPPPAGAHEHWPRARLRRRSLVHGEQRSVLVQAEQHRHGVTRGSRRLAEEDELQPVAAHAHAGIGGHDRPCLLVTELLVHPGRVGAAPVGRAIQLGAGEGVRLAHVGEM